MSGLNYLSEREWVVFTIEEELNNLEYLAPSRQQFSTLELEVLRESLVRLSRIVTNLDKGAEEQLLPRWLQRKPPNAPTGAADDVLAASA
jgi:hypothetical protein